MKNSCIEVLGLDYWVVLICFLSRDSRKRIRKRKLWFCLGRDVLEIGERFCVFGREEKRSWREIKLKYINSFVCCFLDLVVFLADGISF